MEDGKVDWGDLGVKVSRNLGWSRTVGNYNREEVTGVRERGRMMGGS